MLLRKFSQTFKISLAFMLAVFSTGILPTSVSYASHGNNGTVKIGEMDADNGSANANNPHVGCSLEVKWYGFDEGAQSAQVTFEAQPPTERQLISPLGSQHTNFTGNGPGSTLDHTQSYSLAFQGAPQNNQGYHVKVTVNTTSSQGSDTKYKVFWVDGCEPTPATPLVAATAQPCAQGDVTQDVIVNVTNTDDDTNEEVEYTVTIGDQSQDITLANGDNGNLTFSDLAAATYTVNVSGDDGTSTSTTVTVASCTTPTPATPLVAATAQPCAQGDVTQDVIVNVTNTDDDTNEEVDYTVTIGDQSQDITLANGDNGSVTFSGLAADTYDVDVLGSDGTTASTTVMIENCSIPTVLPCIVTTGPEMISKDSDFADYNGFGITGGQDTRSEGHYEFTEDGLHIYTDDNSSQAKVAWYHSVNYSLANIGEPAMDYSSADGIEPGLQIVIDFDGDGTADGMLVGESIYGGDWWLTNGSAQFVKDGAPNTGGGSGSLYYGTLNEWLASFPEAEVDAVGFSLGSGVLADGVLKSLTFGCHTWTFEKEEVIVEEKKTELCHATGSETNPYELIEVSVSSAYNGHLGDGNGDHQNSEDIIPPFMYDGKEYSQNWGPVGQAIYNNGCVVPSQTIEDIDYSIVCVQNGVKITFTNSTSVAGSVTVNGTSYVVPAKGTKNVTLSYDLGTPFMTKVVVTVGTTTATQTVNCVPGGQGGGNVRGSQTGGGQGGGQVLSAVLPAMLPSTGAKDSPFMIIAAALLAYGAAYFLQGRRLLGRKEALSA